VISLIAGLLAGASLGFLTASLVRGGHECECQVPTLGRGAWLIHIDQHGEMVGCKQHVCIDEAFRRLDKAMRSDEA
jgi:hypothetical protein